jgi:membrane protein YqaA with SNARE-associated domain
MDLLANPTAWLAVLAFSIVGIAIKVGSYHAGQRGGSAVRDRFSKIGAERWDQVKDWYDRWGSGLLLMSAIPGLGTLLTAGAGMSGIGFLPLLFWVGISTVTRNWLIVLLLYGGYRRFVG